MRGKWTIGQSGKWTTSLYFVTGGDFDVDGTPVKIGTARNIEKRIAILQTGSPETLRLVFALENENEHKARRGESDLHRFFRDDRIRGEWFGSSQRMRDLAEAFAADPNRAWAALNA